MLEGVVSRNTIFVVIIISSTEKKNHPKISKMTLSAHVKFLEDDMSAMIHHRDKKLRYKYAGA